MTVLLHPRLLLAAAARVARDTVAAAADPRDPGELCCVSHHALHREVYGAEVADRAPLALWRLFPEAGDPWGPVSAVLASGSGDTSAEGQRAAGPAVGPSPESDAALDARAGALPDRGAWSVQIWRGPPLAPGETGHTLVWTTDGDGLGWQLDSVDRRSYDARFRAWRDLVREARGGLRAVRLLAPERARG